MRRVLFLGLLTVCAGGTGLGLVQASEPTPEGLSVGAPIVDFGLRRLDLQRGELGPMVWLTDYVETASGSKRPPKHPSKVVVLSFFATWCKPCVAELALLQRLHQKLGPRGLQVLAVNFRRRGERFEQAVAQTQRLFGDDPPSFPLLFDRYTDRNQLIYMGRRATLPCAIVIDGDGKIRARLQGGSAATSGELERRIVEILERS